MQKKMAPPARTKFRESGGSNLNVLAKEIVKFQSSFAGKKINALLCTSKY